MLQIDFSSPTEQLIELAIAKSNQSDDLWEKKIWEFILNWFDEESDRIHVFTSGSTGKPRPVSHRKLFMLNSARMTSQAINLSDCKTSLLCLPADKISGMMMIVRSIYNQMIMFCPEPSAAPLKNLSNDETIDFAAFTPMQFYPVSNNYANFIRAEKIQKILLGGEGISATLLHSVRQMNNEIYSTFGMTETISHIALRKLTGPSASNKYQTLPGVTISTSENNCLVVDAPQLGVNALHTNDIIRLLSDDEFEWLGRADHVINSGGIKLYPEQIEAALSPFLKTRFFISGSESDITGQKVVLVIEKRTLSLAEIEEIKRSFSQLDTYSKPRELWLVASFAKTSNGKLNRPASLEMVSEKIQL